ncbi:membrane progestin receptor gamma-like [Halichondria panicea]|uniref:membrane progestin receptor gamma-like n=1 Tax=Halichondria panicea TaxID=6063 RepID=UPI00312BA540
MKSTMKAKASKTPGSSKDSILLHRDQVPSMQIEPYIITGYRQPGTSVLGSIRYAFVLHNDVGNFWTHFLPLLAWVAWLAWLAKYRIDFTDPYYYPLLCFWAGACSYVLFSSMAHLLSNISFTVRSVCFTLDYLGIALYALGGAISGFFYEQSIGSPLFKYQGLVLSLDVAIAISATLMCGLTRFYWRNFRYLIRAFSFVFPYATAVAPFIQRLFVCLLTGNECVTETLHLHVSGFFLTFTIAFFFVSKIPERFAPGRFDIYFQSHQLFHVVAVVQTCTQMYMFPLDAQLRKDALSVVEGATPNIYNTLLPFMFAEVVGIVIASVVGVLIVRGVLVYDEKQHYSKTK